MKTELDEVINESNDEISLMNLDLVKWLRQIDY